MGVGIILLMSGLGIITYTYRNHDHAKESARSEIRYYTCPMHPQIHEEHPGHCPICGMTLVPVYKDVGAPLGAPPLQGQGFTISPERQQFAGIKTTSVIKKEAVKEIRAMGRIAFDPELAVAQKEFLEIAKNVPSLKNAATSRLRLLGMSDDEIKALEKKGKMSSDLYLPQKSDPVWIYANLYQEEMNLVTPGLEAQITLPSNSELSWTGSVKAVDPVVDPTTRTAKARIEVKPGTASLKPNTYVDVSLKIPLGEALLVPKSSVIDTGTRKIVFVVHENQQFESREIQTGPEAGDDFVVKAGLVEGDVVVSAATFLVDSESRLKAAVTTQQTTPACSEGEYWDTGMAMCMPKVGK